MRLLALCGWYLIFMIAQYESAPVIKNKNSNNKNKGEENVVGICSNKYDDMIRDLRNNWESPILYLKNRGYIPKNAEPHIRSDEMKLPPQTCSAPQKMKSDKPRGMVEAIKNRQIRAGAIKGLLAINNPTDPPVYRTHQHPKGMTIPTKSHPYQKDYVPPQPSPDLAKEGKSFLKHIKDKIVGLFKGSKIATNKYGEKVFSGNRPLKKPLKKAAYTVEDFDREFESLLSNNYKGRYGGSDDQNEFDGDLDKVIHKKFDKVSSSEYDRLLNMKLDKNSDYLKIMSNQEGDKDTSKMYSKPVIPKP